MRRLFRLLGLTALPLCLIQTMDTVRNIDLRTGFYESGSWVPRIALLAAIAAMALGFFLRVRQSELDWLNPHESLVCAVMFGLSAFMILIASAIQLIHVFLQASFRQIFMTKTALFLMGFEGTHFRVEFWCACTGLLAAVWFGWAAFRFYARGGDLAGHPFFCCLPIIWYCVRAVSDFSISPVNPHNSMILTYIGVNLLLGIFFLRYSAFVSLGSKREDAVRMVHCALLAFLVTISLKTPYIFILSLDSADFLLALADVLTAVTAFVTTDILLKGEAEHA